MITITDIDLLLVLDAFIFIMQLVIIIMLLSAIRRNEK